MIKYYCDLCSQPCEEFTFYSVDIGKITIGVNVKANRIPSEGEPIPHDPKVMDLIFKRHLCNDCAIKAAGQALGLMPKPDELLSAHDMGDKKDIYGNVK